jgi:glycosyltransferase involved in cell wall biosynthesis
VKITIITACFNNADTIRDTINSVLSQSYPDIEYVIVDGNSTDRTLQVVKEFGGRISRIISEKDDGIYFALNKGLKAATGEVIAFLHADDLFANEHVISKVMKALEDEQADSVYGDLVYVDRNDPGKVTRTWISGNYSRDLFLKGWMPPHPAFFLRKKYYDQFGGFNTSFTSAADYELMLRMLYKHKLSAVYIPEVLTKMRVGGKSNVSIGNRIHANKEDRRAWKVNGLKPGMFTLTRKPLSKVFQFLKKG